MTSIINASISSNGIVSTADASGILLCQSNGINTNARAWVQFAGATGTIASSYNVSSITRGGAGVYQVNFTNAFSDNKYCVTTGVSTESGTQSSIVNLFCVSGGTSTAPTTTYFQFLVQRYNTVSNQDPVYMCVSVFG